MLETGINPPPKYKVEYVLIFEKINILRIKIIIGSVTHREERQLAVDFE